MQGALAADGWDLPRSQGNFLYFPLAERSAQFAAFAEQRGLVLRAYGADGVRATIAERFGSVSTSPSPASRISASTASSGPHPALASTRSAASGRTARTATTR